MDKQRSVGPPGGRGWSSRSRGGSVQRGTRGTAHLVRGIRKFAGNKNAASAKAAVKAVPAAALKKGGKGSVRGGKVRMCLVFLVD